MCSYDNPELGDEINFGTQTKIFTSRGWVICDNEDELELEREKIWKSQ